MPTALQRPPEQDIGERREERALVVSPHRVHVQTVGRTLTKQWQRVALWSLLNPAFIVFMSSYASDSLKLTAVTVGLAAGFAGFARQSLRRWRASRHFHQAPLEPHLHGATRGKAARVCGTVLVRQEPLRPLLGGEVVVARYIGMFGSLSGPHPGRVWCETHAVDFDLRLDGDNGVVRISSAHLRLFPDPPKMPRKFPPERASLASDLDGPHWRHSWIHVQETVAAGAEVEVAGMVDFLSDPAGVAGLDRQPRLLPALVGTDERPVYVRVLVAASEATHNRLPAVGV